jgi:predicted dehydrogenase
VTKADIIAGNEGLGPLAGDAVHATYTFESGLSATFDSQRDLGTNPSRFGLRIYGSKGIIEILTGYLPSVKFLPDPSWSPGRSGKDWISVSSNGIGKPESLKDTGLHGGNVAIVKDLIASIEQDRLPLGSVYDARGATEMILAVFESHCTRGPVALPLENRKHPLASLT